MSAPVALDFSSALLIAGSVVVAQYMPALLSYLRAWYILQRIPSPPVDKLISGHARSLTNFKRHKYEQQCVKTIGSVYRLRSFYKNVSHFTGSTSPASCSFLLATGIDNGGKTCINFMSFDVVAVVWQYCRES